MSEAKIREDAMLTELAELSLAVARDLHDAVLATEDLAHKADLAQALQALCRSVRLSIAMRARLGRESRRPWTEPVRDDQPRDREADEDRLMWTERESETETENLEDAPEREDFSAQDIDTHITRTRKRLARYGRRPVEGDAAQARSGLKLQDPPPGRSPIEGEVAAGRRGLKPTLLSTAAAPLRQSSA
jgi:hypothetical protein